VRTTHQIFTDKAEELYSNGGQAEVLAFFTEVPNVEWADCVPCEWESPISNGACLVCGSIIQEED
jgi:hypothetical protein